MLHLKVGEKFPLMFLWCIVTELSLVSGSPYEDDLSLYVILKNFFMNTVYFIIMSSTIEHRY